MVIKGLFQSNPVKTRHDDYFTRYETWASIADLIPRGKVLWEAFYSPQSSSGEHFRNLGFDVIFEDVDFFEADLGEVLVSNMPFSKKKEIFTRLKALGKPFIMLVPTTTLQTLYFTELFKDETIQLIIPRKKINFDKYVDGVKVKMRDNCTFYSCFIAWKCDIHKDVIFI